MQTLDVNNDIGQKRDPSSPADDFVTAFQNPPRELRGKPFWSWNGKLDRRELFRQIDVLRDMGMGGMFMHSRTGLNTEYLGEEWFDLVNACAEKSYALGLESWLYDEDRWPSGSAGGIVTREPAFRMRSIVLSEFGPGETIEWPAPGDFLEAHLADLDGLSLNHYQPVAEGAVPICPEGARILIFAREIHPSHSFYNGGSYLDTLNREGTDRFIEVTHERYLKHCGQNFGKALKGIFTDEPHRGFILCEAVNQPGARKSSHALPYTEKLFEEFKQRFGYSLQGRLPELFFQLGGNALSQLKWHYVELLQQLFIENWARPCLQWCEANNFFLTGHVLHEDSLTAQVVPCGSLFRYYEEMTYPGIDVLGSDNSCYWVAKQVVSVARQQGKPYVLSELYGCTGWATDFLDHKRIGDWQAILGVNFRCHHLSWYTMAGESKRDYPASIFHQSAWYREYNYVETYFARIHHVLQQGTPDCDVLVIHPGESLWAQFHLGWATWLESKSPAADAVEEKFETLFRWLTDSQVDFDYGDEEQLGRLAGVQIIDDKPVLCLGLMQYRVVVVGGMETIRRSTLALLLRFIRAGGHVVFAGGPPSHADAELSEEPKLLREEATRTAWQKSETIRAVRARSEQLLSVNDGFGAEGILSQVRLTEGDGICIAMVNTTGKSIESVTLGVPGAGKIEELDCRTGQVLSQPKEETAEGMIWRPSFGPWRERLFRISDRALDDGSKPQGEPAKGGAEIPLLGPYRYELNEPNSLALDRACHRLEGGEWQPETDVLRIDESIRDRLGWTQRTGQMAQPWCAKEETMGPRLELAYSFQVRECSAPVELVLEQPERWKIELNGTAVEAGEDDSAWFVDIALRRIVLPQDSLKVGTNQVHLRTRMRPSTDIEAIYLIGRFGVYRESAGFVVGVLPHQVEVGDLVEQGFPFYTGIFTYKCLLPSSFASGPTTVILPRFGGACARIHDVAGEQILAFPPHEVVCDFKENSEVSLDVMLTRQNLFGPFHRLPKEESFTGPDSFRTRGENYCEEHQFFPSGLLDVPLLRF